MNPLKSISGTIILGILLGLAAVVALGGEHANPIEWTVWLHVIVGIAWVGLLYYFNFIQVPAVGEALADGDPGPAAINKYIAPKALLWFRWAAIATWLTGASALAQLGNGMQGFYDAFMFANGMEVIGMGAWLGTIMLFNVWVLIWPNQKKILGMVDATPEEIAKAKVVALMASRTNTALSIPMLLGMTAFGHGLPF
ncbi:MAG: urate hydroxylase PuuD [Gammaproteobacteria bacterium]|nr:urate hydroxylase PuuD [Gammaproteobacteria bacterium]